MNAKLNGNRPEVEAGGLRVLVQELFNQPSRMYAQNENFDWIHRAALALSADDLGDLTANQIRELRQQVQTYAKLIEAQSVGLNSLARQLRWFREFRDAAVPLLDRFKPWTCDNETYAKVKNLLTAQYDGESMWNDLLEMASQIILVDTDRGNVVLQKMANGAWHIWGRSHQTGERWLLGETGEVSDYKTSKRMDFASVEAAYAWFLANGAEILERCKNPDLERTLTVHK